MDFRWNRALIIEDLNGSQGGILFEYYMCTTLLVPFAYGPFPRNDLQINLLCKTASSSHQLNNWTYKDDSLRQLGWLCTQQHVTLTCSGPKIQKINLSKFTNTFFQVLKDMQNAVTVTPLELPFVQELLPSKRPASDPALAPPMASSSMPGSNSVNSIGLTRIVSTRNRFKGKTKSSVCSLLQVAWASENVKQSVLKHSATSAWPHSSLTTRNAFIIKSQWACVWRWVWKGIDTHTPQPHRRNSHLVPTSCGLSAPSSWKKVAHIPLSCGVVPSWGSSPSVAQVKLGVLSNPKTKTISSSGRTYPLDLETPPKKELTRKQSGSMSVLIPTKEIATRKAVRFVLEETKIRCYVPSKPYGGYKKEETTSTFGIFPIAEFLKSAKEWSSIGRRSSTRSRKLQETMEWTQSASRDIIYGSVEPRNSCQRASTKQSSSLWVDGSQTATWPTSDSIQL